MQRRSSHFHARSHERSANSLTNCSKQGRWLIWMGDCIRGAALMSDATLPAASDLHADLSNARQPSLFLTRWPETMLKLHNPSAKLRLSKHQINSQRQMSDTSFLGVNMKSSCQVRDHRVPALQIRCKNQVVISVGAVGDKETEACGVCNSRKHISHAVPHPWEESLSNTRWNLFSSDSDGMHFIHRCRTNVKHRLFCFNWGLNIYPTYFINRPRCSGEAGGTAVLSHL